MKDCEFGHAFSMNIPNSTGVNNEKPDYNTVLFA